MTSSRTTIRFASPTVTPPEPPPEEPVGSRYYGVAEFPRERFEPAYSLPTGTRRVVTVTGTSSNFQAQLNAAQRGDVIVLPAGAVITDRVVLPEKAGDGWIYIVSSAVVDTTFPVPVGQRATPAHATAMPTLRVTASGASSSRIRCAGRDAARYRLVGLRFDVASTVTGAVGRMVQLGTPDADDTDTIGWPQDIVVDRCLFVGAPTQNIELAILAHVHRLFVTGCGFHGINIQGADSQCVGGWKYVHGWHIDNCYLEGATELIMTGGAQTVIGREYTDITVRRCHLQHLPWRQKDAPQWNGINYALKNLFEVKGATRVLVEDNLFDNYWGEDQDATINLKTAGSGGRGSVFARDIILRFNLLEQCTTMVVVTDQSDGLGETARVVVAHNLSQQARNGQTGTVGYLGSGKQIVLANNTMLAVAAPASLKLGRPGTVPLLRIEDNIFARGNNGIKGGALEGTQSLNECSSGSIADGSKVTMRKNVMVGAQPSRYPASNAVPVQPATWDAVGFVDYAGGNYRIAPSSPYSAIGTDGKDPGADIDAVLYRTRGCRTGIWT